MALGTAATIGLSAAGGALASSALSGGGSEGGMKKTSTLSPEQKKLMKKVAPWIEERIGRGLPAWEGRFAAPVSEYEKLGLEKLKEYTKSDIPDIAKKGLGTYQQALAGRGPAGGMTPEETTDWYEKYRQPSRERAWKEDIEPAIRESFVGPGTFYGTPRGRETAERAVEWSQLGQQELGDIVMGEREAGRRAALTGLGLLPEVSGIVEEAPMRRAKAGIEMGALPRLVKQTQLMGEMEEFKRTTPELSPIIDKAIALLRTTTQAGYYQKPTPSPFMELLGAVAPGVGAGLGSYLAGGGSAAGAAAAAASDVRLKKNIQFKGEYNGLKWYTWDWINGAKRIVGDSPTYGVIAQEVLKIRPEAVFGGSHGYLMVDYGQLADLVLGDMHDNSKIEKVKSEVK